MNPGLLTDAISLTDANGNLLAQTFVSGTGIGPQFAFQFGSQNDYSGYATNPSGVAVGPDGTYYIADQTEQTITRFNIDGEYTSIPLSSLCHPAGIAVDGSGTIYVADPTFNQVVAYSAAGVQTVMQTTPLLNPTWVAIDGSGALYISDSGNGRIIKLDNQNVETTLISGLNSPQGIAVDSFGNLFFADQGRAGELQELQIATGQVVPIANQLGTMQGVALDASGRVYYTTTVALGFMDPATGESYVSTTEGSDGPYAVAIAQNGNIITSQTSDEFFVITQAATGSLPFFGAQLGSTTSATFTIANTGNADLAISGLSTSGTQFSIDSSTQCNTDNAVVAGATCDVTVDFTPSNTNVDFENVTATSNSLNVSGSQNQLALEGVGQAPPTQTVLGASPASPSLGQTITFTAMVSQTTVPGLPAPQGSVDFYDYGSNTDLGSVALAEGSTTAVLTTNSIAPGYHEIFAYYSGDASNSSSLSNEVQFALGSNVSANLAVSATNLALNQPETLTVTIGGQTAPPTGTVTFFEDGTQVGSSTLPGNTSNPVVSITLPSLTGGTHIFSATYSGDANYASDPTNTVNVTVAQEPYSTSLAVSATTLALNQPETLNVTFNGQGIAPTGTVTFYEDDGQVGSAMLTGNSYNNLVSITLPNLAGGSHSFFAVYSGDNNYASVDTNAVSVTVTQGRSATSLSISPANPSVNRTVSLTATVTSGTTPPESGSVVFSDQNGVLGSTGITSTSTGGIAIFNSPLTVGSHQITAMYTDDASYSNSSSTIQTIVVGKGTPLLNLTVSAGNIKLGQTEILKLQIGNQYQPLETGTVTFSDQNGVLGTGTMCTCASGNFSTLSLTTLTLGTHQITATIAGDSNYAAVTSNYQTVTVSGDASTTTTLSLSAANITVGQLETLTATIPAGQSATPSGTVTFSDQYGLLGTSAVTGSNPSAVLNLSSLTAGSHTITATYNGDSTFAASTSPAMTVNVSSLIYTSTAFSVSSARVIAGSPVTFTVTVTPAMVSGMQPDGSATYTDSDGTVIGTSYFTGYSPTVMFTTSSLAVGQHTITAVYSGDQTYAGSTSRAVTVTVAAAMSIPVITWANPAAITYGTALSATQLDATVTGVNGAILPGTFAYTDAGKSITPGSLLTAGTHTLTLLFTPTDTTSYTTATKSVTLIVNKATPLVAWAKPASVPDGTLLSATQLDATATGVTGAALPGTFTYTPIAGSTLTTGLQTLSVLFTPTDIIDYTTAPQTTQISVIKASPVITWANPAAISYGTLLSAAQLDATVTGVTGTVLPGTFAYTDAGKALTTGSLLTAGTHTLTLLFTPTDTTDYSTATKSVTLIVNKATPLVTWAKPASVPDGTLLSATQLDATATGVTGTTLPGIFVYTPTAGSTLTTGLQTLSVLFTPTDIIDYTTAPQTTQISVTKATPVITWVNPSAITYGTLLSATQLDATVTGLAGTALPGIFAYTDAGKAITSGSLLTAGTHTLTLLFTPTDATDYTTTTRSVTLLINKAAPLVTWAIPAAITQGTPLSSTQLDASATGVTGAKLPGNFVYIPAAGSILGVGTQTLSVLFMPADTTDYTTATKTTTEVVGQATPTVTWTMPAGITYGTALSGTQLNAVAKGVGGASLLGTFTYTPAAGKVLPAGTQTLSVLFSPADTTDYTAATQTTSIVVAKATPTLTWAAPLPITQGTELTATQLDATATGVGGIILPGISVYTPAAGTALGIGTQTLSVLFMPTDAVDYTTATKTNQIVISSPVTKVGLSSRAGSSEFGQSITLTATLGFAGTIPTKPTGTVTFRDGTTTLGSAQLMTQIGTLSLSTLGAGSHSITAQYSGDATYGSSTSSPLTLVVLQGLPQVAWTPATSTIVYGTPLSGAQLNATASTPYSSRVAGSLVYTPALGTVVGAGVKILSVVFTATDQKDYKTASGSTTITVEKATPKLTWATPASVVVGTALASAQLDAAVTGVTGAALSGTFTYMPAAGSLATSGAQTLKVLFTPADRTDYTTATMTVQLVGTDLALTGLSSTTALLGDAAKTITLTGTGFLPSSIVQVNGVSVTSAYSTATTLTAAIPATEFQTVQTLRVTVVDSTQKQTSNALQISVTAPPVPVEFSGPSTVTPAAQPTAKLTLTNPYPVTLTGTVALSFAPLDSSVTYPPLQFTGGKTVMTFTIPANTTVTPTIQFQAGTVAGAISLTLDLTAGGMDVTPTTIRPIVIEVPPAVPGITSATFTQEGDQVTVKIMGYSNTIQVSQAAFAFTAATSGSLKDPDVSVNVDSIFSGYYRSGMTADYGSTFVYSQTFTLSSGATISQIAVTLTNSAGTSAVGITP